MIRIVHADALSLLRSLEPASFDAIVTDPPYGETSLGWDRWPRGWLALCLPLLKPSGSLWCFGSMRMFLAQRAEFEGWRFVQDIVWEKQNGTGASADRFRRVHEHACQFVPETSRWAEIYKTQVTTPDAVKRQVRRKRRPVHWGDIGESTFSSEDGGPRLMRSVVYMRNCHGRAIHPTQKPEGIVEPLLRYSVPPGGRVLDPFCGSGTTLAVARELGMEALGIEANEKYALAAERRLAESLPLGGAA